MERAARASSSRGRLGHHATGAMFVAAGLAGGGGPAVAGLSSTDPV
jgi:hypothetical protein